MKVRVGKVRSVKLADYQYFKPEVSLEIEIPDDDASKDRVKEVSEDLSLEIDSLLDDIVRRERQRMVTDSEIEELQEVLEDEPKTSAKYRLAKARLEELGAI